MDPVAADLDALATLARRAICQAKRRRKYSTPGPYSGVELEALQGLAAVAHGIEAMASERRRTRAPA